MSMQTQNQNQYLHVSFYSFTQTIAKVTVLTCHLKIVLMFPHVYMYMYMYVYDFFKLYNSGYTQQTIFLNKLHVYSVHVELTPCIALTLHYMWVYTMCHRL